MDWLKQFPEAGQLTEMYPDLAIATPLKVNNHIHSPHSFSAFKNMEVSVRMAAREDVRILGINDFYVAEGYGEFIGHCTRYGIFPLLNIELIGISAEEQRKGIRVNDPNNPGRTYISGKGLAFPFSLPVDQQEKLDRVIGESNRQVARMIGLLNRWLTEQGAGVNLTVEEIMRHHAFKLLRERHVARVLRLKLEELAGSNAEFRKLLQQVYGGRPSEKQPGDTAGLEDELRARLLKAGAPAFVPEDEKAFLSLEEIVGLIRDAGGIPTYPLLVDGAGGNITEFESDPEQLRQVLEKWGIRSVEFIPLRNRYEKLKEYAAYFYAKGFTVSFGTEHNTAAMIPLTVSCKGNVPLDDELMRISYCGAACIAAHQYLVARGDRQADSLPREEMEKIGHAVISHYFRVFLSSPRGNRLQP